MTLALVGLNKRELFSFFCADLENEISGKAPHPSVNCVREPRPPVLVHGSECKNKERDGEVHLVDFIDFYAAKAHR